MKSPLRPAFRHLALQLVVTGSLVLTGTSRAQILDRWTHQSTVGEASAAVAMDDRYMFVADNEDEFLRLYDRAPVGGCTAPAYVFDARPHLYLSSSNPEVDLEAAVKVSDGAGTRIYWLGSHSNSKNAGKFRPNRNRLFATEVGGDGTGSPAYSLGYLGRYDYLRDDLISWDLNNRHGLGANYYGLAASAASGVVPSRVDGFNLEGLVMSPDGSTAYLAFRTPLVNGSGPTTSLSQRTNSLIVPLLNMRGLVSGTSPAAPGSALFGTPFTLNLGSRGVRSIDSGDAGQYLITAGPAGDTSFPPVAPYNFRLFTWSGDPADMPIERRTEFPAGFNPEGAMVPSGAITPETVIQFVSDDASGCWASFTARAGSGIGPALRIVPGTGGLTISWPACARGFSLQECNSLARQDWVDCAVPPTLEGGNNVVIAPASGLRFYRLMQP